GITCDWRGISRDWRGITAAEGGQDHRQPDRGQREGEAKGWVAVVEAGHRWGSVRTPEQRERQDGQYAGSDRAYDDRGLPAGREEADQDDAQDRRQRGDDGVVQDRAADDPAHRAEDVRTQR